MPLDLGECTIPLYRLRSSSDEGWGNGDRLLIDLRRPDRTIGAHVGNDMAVVAGDEFEASPAEYLVFAADLDESAHPV